MNALNVKPTCVISRWSVVPCPSATKNIFLELFLIFTAIACRYAGRQTDFMDIILSGGCDYYWEFKGETQRILVTSLSENQFHGTSQPTTDLMKINWRI